MKNETGITPLNDRVLVRPDPIAKKSAAGVLIDKKSTVKKPVYGTVLAVGTRPMKEKFFVEAGDKVMYLFYAGNEFNHKGENLLMMKESDLWCKIN